MSLLKFVFVLVVLAVSLTNVLAVSSEEKQKLHADAFSYIVDCNAQFGVTMDDTKKVEKSNIYATLEPCIMGCVFKKNDLIDDKGLYDALKAEVFIKKYLSDEVDLKKGLGIISNCKAVNNHKVTDGEKGCERAKLLLECFNPLKAMFDN